jgi:hypothetical protein
MPFIFLVFTPTFLKTIIVTAQCLYDLDKISKLYFNWVIHIIYKVYLIELIQPLGKRAIKKVAFPRD